MRTPLGPLRTVVVSAGALLLSVALACAAIVPVTTTADSLAGSLRQAIGPGSNAGDTIVFQIPTTDPGYNSITGVFTIGLTSAELTINKDLTIDGAGAKIVVRRNSGADFSIFNITAGTVAISRLALANGKSGGGTFGGSINHVGGTLILNDCTLTGGQGSTGGLFNGGGASAAVNNCTLVANGGIAGAGIQNAGMLTLTNSTITGNGTSGSGGAGVRNQGTARVRNSIIAGNINSSAVAADVSGNFISEGYNFVGSGSASTGFGNAGSQDQVGTLASPANPSLGPLQDNGGLTQTRRPLPGSLVIDQGNRGNDSNGQPINTDQRAQPRPIDQPGINSAIGGDGSDIGAVEVGLPQAGPNFRVTTTLERNGTCASDDCTLLEAMNAANGHANASTITFASDVRGSILNTLVPGGLNIVNPMTISGPGARLLTISGNNASRLFNVPSGVTATISGLTIANANTGTGSGGGVSNAGLLTLQDCAVLNNSGGSGGGAVNSGNLDVINCTFAGNQSTGNGGALRNAGTLRVTNSTFNNNTAVNSGAISSFVSSEPAAAVTLVNCTVSGNKATEANGQGGGLFNGNLSTTTVRNTIVVFNTVPNGNNGPDAYGSFSSGGHNMIRVSFGNNFVNGFDGDLVGGVFYEPHPSLAPLQNNGGPTDTMALQSDSEARDKGNDLNAPPTDQRGYVRSGTSDIGAFEFGGLIPSRLANISTRLRVETGDNVLFGGFIITGTQAKKLIVRAIGPSVPVAGRLENPTLELYSGDTLLASNDNWMDSPEKQAIIASTIPPANNLESAIVRSLAPGSYTTIVRGVNQGTGVGLVEIYDLDGSVDSKLAQISTRGFVQTGDNAMFGGLYVVGGSSQKVIVRAIGPSLSFPGKLDDPTLELYDGNGTSLGANDNWRTGGQEAEIIATTVPPSDNLESAIVRTFAPGPYTAIVRGVNNATGIALVEVYALQ